MLLTLFTEEATVLLAGELSRLGQPPLVVYLQGQLGAGKTTFSRGFLAGLGYKGKVKSPTYTLVESYSFADYHVFHFDLYRIHAAEELELIGIRDYFQPNSFCLIEWPERGKGILPSPDLVCYFELTAEGRQIAFSPRTTEGDKIISRLSRSR